MKVTKTMTLALTLCGAAIAFGQQPVSSPAGGVDREQLREHYEQVERELLRGDVSSLSPHLLRARKAAIETLRAYRERGDFGRCDQVKGARPLAFIDDEGRRCAVAELLHAVQRSDLVTRVAATRNDAFVAELAVDAELCREIEAMGLTLWEAARIQGPMGGRVIVADNNRRAEPGSYSGPGDTTTVAPRTSGSQGSAANSSTPAGGTTVSGPSTAPSSVIVPTNHQVGSESWWTWWELHKLDYLRPNMMRNWVATVTGYSRSDGHPARQLAMLRKDLFPLLLRELEKGDPTLRAAAVLALGRMAGSQAVAPLTRALDDASMLVRERAILALGAGGDEQAAELLLSIARHGALKKGGGRICPDARPLAIVALGIARRNGLDPVYDELVGRLSEETKGRRDADVQTALIGYHTLNPAPALAAWSAERVEDKHTSDPVRCRAVESLRFDPGAESLSRLLRALTCSKLELRRSAALALGEFDSSMALPPLLTAAELEREPLARGFILISIGRQGGEAARDFLVDYLKNGKKSHRPWCALALGILARGDDDAEARTVLRENFKRERNRGARGAWYLALGIGGATDALPLLEEGLIDGSTPETRSSAAFGLAMVGGEQARTLLLERLAEDPCPYTRAVIAQSLGYMGDARDSEVLVEALRSVKNPDLQSSVSLALGLHGSRKALEGLVAIAKSESSSRASRAAALEAVQMLVGTGPNLTLGDLLRQTNFAVFPSALIRHMDLPL